MAQGGEPALPCGSVPCEVPHNPASWVLLLVGSRLLVGAWGRLPCLLPTPQPLLSPCEGTVPTLSPPVPSCWEGWGFTWPPGACLLLFIVTEVPLVLPEVSIAFYSQVAFIDVTPVPVLEYMLHLTSACGACCVLGWTPEPVSSSPACVRREPLRSHYPDREAKHSVFKQPGSGHTARERSGGRVPALAVVTITLYWSKTAGRFPCCIHSQHFERSPVHPAHVVEVLNER